MSEQILNKGITLVDFWASWCGPCRTMHPILEKLETDIKENFKVIKINVDEPDDYEYRLIIEHNIKSIPFFAIYKDNQLIKTLTGVQSYSALKLAIEQIMGE